MKIGQLLGFFALVISLYILWEIRRLLLLLFTAIVLATAISQLVQRFQRSGMQRIWAVWLSLLIVLIVLIGCFVLIVPPFIDQFEELVQLFPTGVAQIQQMIIWLEGTIVGPYITNLPDINNLIQQLQPLTENLLRQAIGFFSTGFTAVLELLLVIILTLMLLVNPQPYRKVFVRCFPSFYRHRVEEILTLCGEGLGHWTVGALITMVFIGFLSLLGLLVLRVPLALAHAVLAGLLNFIPNIGPTLSVILPMTIGFLDAPWKAIAVLILYLIIQNIESYWLTPTVMAKQVALLPAFTLTAQLFFAGFFGALGLIMALPLAVVAKTWIEELVFKDILDKWKQTSS
ncbi:AI-2E family transporter [Nodularia spumigena]|mgnify:CR=1 FL=1|jgi:predicted PurR-regulated permease PerM|uniref:AI-2E family transporter n=1 Tax=Nodularia spumigena UHCC 0060 TaxID=3110300 RepID=A0ABU5UL47_NODSP|nr:AI-2E family transporter [Nodularia spumigena]MEA5525254.1 AI-2E family transporter [Nodularia spumigena UHCC 0143]MEA5557007.1 AI-2E family transporter [Nodularia spumigena CH309]MEA5607006.1 AI-2E family transporter [Nodularia spumigena UHCC 0060]MEA5614742.1 AI-2E family transporter [Nodularia spumigena UHCC 0040]